MGDFKDLIAQLYLACKPTQMPFERFFEQTQVAIYHATKLPKRCQRDLEIPTDINGAFIFHA